MVQIDVAIADCMHEFTSFKSGDMSDHVGQNRIGRDVKRHSKALKRNRLYYKVLYKIV